MYDSGNVHGSSLVYFDHSTANCILVHPLYASVRLLDRVRLAAATLYSHTLRGPVVPHTPGVPFSARTWQFTALCRQLHCKQHFRTPFLRICKATYRVRPTVATDRLHILGGPIEPRRLGVRIHYRVWHFPTPCGQLCSKQHFRIPFVRICTSL